MRLGMHVPAGDPVSEAEARGAEVVQIFLGPPQSYKKPPPRNDAETLRASPVPIYVHAPYPINVATTENRIRHPSRQTLTNAIRAAEAIGAVGIVVHGGHVRDEDDPEAGFANWRTTFERLETDLPVLIENTAGGENAMAREVDRIARLWEVLDGVEVPFGLCLDTCHLHAAGEDLVAGTDRLIEVTGGITLIHLNDSRDEPGSGRDRHTNLGAGHIPPDALVEVVRRADCDVVCETPGDVDRHRQDLAWIRDRLA